jgi:hypothetical protein
MRNPLRSEAEAFRFLIAVIIGALVIVGAAYLNTWLGVAAAVVVVAGILWWLMQEPIPGAADSPPRLESETPRGTHRVLVVAAPGTTSVQVAPSATDIIVVVPALASTVEALTGAVDDRPRAGLRRGCRTPAARSARTTSGSRSRMRCGRSAPTRSSSQATMRWPQRSAAA